MTKMPKAQMMKPKLPIFYCREENGLWVFDCTACGSPHMHSPGNGHRVSHCKIEDAYPYGYIIEEDLYTKENQLTKRGRIGDE
jgi:hypothetical protein